MNLKGRNFLTLKDFTPEEILYMVDLAAELKDKKKKGIVEQPLIGKNMQVFLYGTALPTNTILHRCWQMYLQLKRNLAE